MTHDVENLRPRDPFLRRESVRRSLWGLVGQGLSSLSNFGVALVAVRSSSASEFGAFSVAFATFLMVSGLTRALISDVYAVRQANTADNGEGGRYPFARDAVSAALGIGLVASLLCVAVAVVAGGDLRNALVALAAGLPALVAHDVCRYIATTRRDAFGSMLFDVAWVAFFAIAIGALVVAGTDPNPAFTLLLWEIGAVCGFVVAMWRFRILPGVSMVRWVRMSNRFGVRYLFDWLAIGASVTVGYYLLGATAGLAVVGDLRAALLLVGPVNILFAGSTALAIPEFARYRAGGNAMIRPTLMLAAALVVVCLAWCIGVALLPESSVRSVMGDHAAAQLPLLWLLALYAVTSATAQAPHVTLRSSGDVARGTRATLPAAPLLLLGASIGAKLFGGAEGALAGLAFAQIASTLSASWQLHRSTFAYQRT